MGATALPCSRSESFRTWKPPFCRKEVHSFVLKPLVWQKQYLKIHLQTIHEGLNYPCNQCEFTATQKGDVIRHIQSKHQISNILAISAITKKANRLVFKNTFNLSMKASNFLAICVIMKPNIRVISKNIFRPNMASSQTTYNF